MTLVARVRYRSGMTNTTRYVVRPTEPDGDIVAYEFANEFDVWDYVTETLGYEYGMDATDIQGTDILGYRYTTPDGMSEPVVIGTVTRI